MKLYTDLDIVNGLSTCRDMFEAKAYLKANNIAISDQELEVLQSQYSKINSERTLTEELLNKVAGGMFSVEAHKSRSVGAKSHTDSLAEANERFKLLTFNQGRRVMEDLDVEGLIKGLVAGSKGRRDGITLSDAISAAKYVDACLAVYREGEQQHKAEIADLMARVSYYEQRFGEIPNLREVIPGTPPGSP